ncbi:MAG: glycosyltransferase [Paludibacteraceae bacterium]|nr:glycosyltransferase [Paludibacteraceae bacterium]
MKTDLTLAICMYNAEKYIEETLLCIMAQTKQDFYLMIINDCSTDSSADVVNRFFVDHPRQYEMVNLPENRGLAFGRRYVEEHADTKYLLFVDADDCPLPLFVEKLYDKISSDSQLMAVGCYLEYMNLDGKKTKGGIFIGETSKNGFYQKALKEKLIFMASTSIYNREVALSVGGHNIYGFPEGKPRYQDLCEDLDLWTRMSDLYVDGKAIIVVPEVLYKYRKGDGISTGAYGMLLRMRHIKTNLKRRRSGDKELSFIDFQNSLSEKEIASLKKEAAAVNSFRNAYYYLKKGNFLLFIKNIFISIYNNPKYMMDKIKHNLLRIK